MTFMAMRHLHYVLLPMAGLAGCASSVNDYLVEARRGDPESVQEAVVNVGRLLREKEDRGIPYDKGDEDAVKYLTEVAEIGKDAVNRASAVDNLSHLRRPRLTNIYVRRLEDRSWSVQLDAAKALARNPDADSVPALSKRLDDEIRVEVRLEIVKALTAIGGEPALRKLLEALLDPSGRYAAIRLTVHDGVRKLSGKEFGLGEHERWTRFQAERFPLQSEPAPPLQPAPAGDPGEKNGPGTTPERKTTPESKK